MTIDQRGASSIYAPSTGNKSAYVILAIRLDGKKASPLITNKGEKVKLNVFKASTLLKPKKTGALKQL